MLLSIKFPYTGHAWPHPLFFLLFPPTLTRPRLPFPLLLLFSFSSFPFCSMALPSHTLLLDSGTKTISIPCHILTTAAAWSLKEGTGNRNAAHTAWSFPRPAPACSALRARSTVVVIPDTCKVTTTKKHFRQQQQQLGELNFFGKKLLFF